MSAEENKTDIRRAYDELWNERNVEVVDELATEDFLNQAAPPDRQRGRQDLKHVVRMFEDTFPDFRYEVKDMIAEGEKIAVRDVFRSTHQGDFMGILATGKPRHHRSHPHLPLQRGQVDGALGGARRPGDNATARRGSSARSNRDLTTSGTLHQKQLAGQNPATLPSAWYRALIPDGPFPSFWHGFPRDRDSCLCRWKVPE